MNLSIDVNKTLKIMDDINILLFKYIKENNFIEFEKIIDKYKLFNYNIADDNNVYLIEYLILLNKPDLIKKIFTNDSNIIFNINYVSLIEIIIKFSYYEIMEILIEKNKKMIGLNFLEITHDNIDIPLFCALKYQNIEFVKIILKAMSNIYLKNKNGNNALHQIITEPYNNFELFKIIANAFTNKNIFNDEGYTALLLAVFYKKYEYIKFLLENDADYKLINLTNNYSILHYIVISNDELIIEIFKPYINNLKCLSNEQDISGNIYFHYFIPLIINNNEHKNNILFDFYIQLEPNYNIQNIDSNTCFHLIFENLHMELYDKYIKYLIKHTNINIQNNLGYSCFFLLIINKIYINYFDELKYKKINIFMFNSKKEHIFNYIKKDTPNYDELINLVITSYINNINKNLIYYDYWDNVYTRDFKNLNNKDKEELKIMNIKTSLNIKQMYHKILHFKLDKQINYFIKTNTILNTMFSYPKTKIYPELLTDYQPIYISTFSSSIINLFFGLMYLNKKFKNIATMLNILNYEKDILYYNGKPSIKNFQLLWKNYKLINVFDNLGDKIKFFMDNNYDYFIITLGIEIYKNDIYNGHMNIILIDLKKKTVEKYEPYNKQQFFFLYDEALLHLELNKLFNSMNLNLTYIYPKQTHMMGLQLLEIQNNDIFIEYDKSGYCMIWSLFWVQNKLLHPSINSQKLNELIIIEASNKTINMKQLIIWYSNLITNYRDIFFSNINITITDWDNNNQLINEKSIHKLNKIIMIELMEFL
jgi:ankyrin repeat protein